MVDEKPNEETCKLVADAVKAMGPDFEPKSAIVNCDEFREPDYRIKLKSGGNRILTPLEIPDFKELSTGSTKNKEAIDFTVTQRMGKADSLLIEVLDGEKVIFSDTNTAGLISGGDWQWDGYDTAGVLDTKVLKSKNLKVRLTASKGSKQYVDELKLSNKAKEADWVDAKVDRNAKTVEVTVRPAFSDGGISGPAIPGYTPKTFEQLKAMAKQGIEMYWTRDGSRSNGTNPPVQTAKGVFSVTVKADVNVGLTAENFELKIQLDKRLAFWFIRPDSSTSAGPLSKIVHAPGDWLDRTRNISYSDPDFECVAAHEFGHRILGAYGNRGYSWGHKGTSGKYSQTANPGTSYPAIGEIDLMKYSKAPLPNTYQDRWNRTIAAEEDVKALLWLARIKSND